MDNNLYNQLKHCWKMGYKLPKIKEYCDTSLTIDELQTEFMEMWENELVLYGMSKLAKEDQINGFYEADLLMGAKYKDYTPSQIADLYNFIDSDEESFILEEALARGVSFLEVLRKRPPLGIPLDGDLEMGSMNSPEAFLKSYDDEAMYDK